MSSKKKNNAIIWTNCATELKDLASLLKCESLSENTHSIFKAANLLEKMKYTPSSRAKSIKKMNIDWGYNINGLVVTSASIPRGVFPANINMIRITINYEMYAVYEDYNSFCDPFKYLSIEVKIDGIDKVNGTFSSAFHIDRDLDSSSPSIESHPAYHIHFGGDCLDYHKKQYGEMLFMGAPRIMIYPMDFYLALEFIGDNFFPDKLSKMKQNVQFNKKLKDKKEKLWHPYFDALSSHWNGGSLPKNKWLADKILPQLKIQ
ncbi:hypothetical protein BAC3_00854 [uncultured bacterium]|nr:hypothetical protein BAC3_00854 [uncultured bacterium]